MRPHGLTVVVLLALMFVGPSGVVAATPREWTLDYALRSVAAEIKCQNEHFLVIYRGPTSSPGPSDQSIIVLGKTGKSQFERNPGYDIPGVNTIVIRDIALSSSGLLVICASVWAGTADSVILVYDISKKALVHVIRVSPIDCEKLAVDYADNLWCLGLDVPKRDTLRQDYNLVYRFSWDGKIEGRHVLRSSLPNDGQFGPQSKEPFVVGKLGDPQIVPCGSGVLLWLPNARTLIWVEPKGETDRVLFPSVEPVYGGRYSLTADRNGSLFAVAPVADGSSNTLYSVDVRGSLTRVSDNLSLGKISHVIGIEKGEVVLWDRSAGKVVWVPTK